MKIFYHADDFGVTCEQSERMLDCFLDGRMNSVSILLNSPEAKETYQLISPYVQDGKLRCVAHLNFVEGQSMTPGGNEDVPHLTDESGRFSRSFVSLFLAGLGPGRHRLKEEVKKEIRAQLACFFRLTGSKIISIDSHQHYHMIPFVWDALREVILEEGYQVEYVRIPADPVKPLLKSRRVFRVPLKNYVKWGLLHFLKYYAMRKRIPGAESPLFFGMPYTCRMTGDVVENMLPWYLEAARERDADLELMFHPGEVRERFKLLDGDNPDLVGFYSSPYRELERKALLDRR